MRCAMWKLCVLLSLVAVLVTGAHGDNVKQPIKGEILKELGVPEAKMLVQWYDNNILRVVNEQAKSEWTHSTNMTSFNEDLMIQGKFAVSNFTKIAYQTLSKYDWKNLTDEDLRRQFKQMVMPGHAALPKDKLRKLLSIEANMLEIHSETKICRLKDTGKLICITDKEISNIFSNSTHEPTLSILWKLWHDHMGKKMRQPFEDYVKLSTEMAIGNEFADLGELWRSSYEIPTLEEDVFKLYQQIKPLYMQLHAYARRQLRQVYGSKIVPNGGLLPCHLLGDVFAYDWRGIPVPFPNISSSNITQRMLDQNYTVKTIIEVAENFFITLGLPPMSQSFWNNSIFEDPEDGRKIMCHGTAWDFYDKKDFRMLICADVIAEQLYTIHHEMGHIHYFMQYRDQPYTFRTGANPAFHEAIGDLILLSVMTPNHLHSIGLLDSPQESRESDINFLFTEALSSVAQLPSSYIVDKWRWDIFAGKYNSTEWNDYWWQLRKEYQGMSPPIERKKMDLDASVIFHVATFAPFIRYFLSGILKYQFHRALCKASGLYVPNDPEKPLFKCDIYGSEKAGELLRNMLKMGASKKWQYAMKMITQGEEDNFDGSALMEYYKPLMDFLVEENAKHGEIVGWHNLAQTRAFHSASTILASSITVTVAMLVMSKLLSKQ
ncbi:hypothetical protein CHUAL_012727 [Chamberlinius hualienensis]